MNTIDYTAKGQKVQFSKKAVNINGKDYAYTGMTAIKHSSAKHLYLFKYEDSWRMLPYNEEDEQKLKVLFARIADLNAKRADALARKAAADAVTVAPPTPKIDVKSIMETAEETPVETVAEPIVEPAPEVPVVEPEPVVEETPAEEPAPVEEPVVELEPVVEEPESVEEPVEPVAEPEPVAEEVPSEESAPVEEPVEETPAEEVPAEEPAPTEEVPEEAPAEEAPAEDTAEPIFPPEEKKKKLKKSFLIFAAVLAAFIILGVVYFFVLGTSNNPTVGPNSNETQQYEDIDSLIEDLQDDN